MAKLTPEQKAFIEENGIDITGTSLSLEEEETTEAPPVDPNISKFVEENPDIDLSGTSLDPLIMMGGTAEDWQAEAEKYIPPETTTTDGVEMRDDFSYQNLYSEYTNPVGETVERPDYGTWDAIGAAWQDAFSKTDEKKPKQVLRDEYENWAVAAKNLYEGNTFYEEDGKKIYDRYVPVKDENNQIVEYKYEKVLIPNPLIDRSAFNRVMDQAGRNIYQEIGGLVTERAIMGSSKFAETRADMDLSGGEEIGATILSIAAPTLPVAKGIKYVGSIVKAAKGGAKAGSGGIASTVLAESLAGAITETVMSSEGDEGMFVKGSKIQETFPIFTESQSENIAMFVDGLALNGIMDGMLSIAGKTASYGYSRLASAGKLGAKAHLKEAIKKGTVLEVAKYLDPDIVNLTPTEVKIRLHSLANKLNDNRIINLALGDFQGEIANDSVNALLMSADAYIRETRAGLKATLSEAEFEEMVEKEAARMSTSMIGLFRSQQSNPGVAATVDSVPEQIGGFINEAADNRLDGRSLDEAAQDTATALVKGSDTEVAAINNQIDAVSSQTDEILDAQATVLQNNPILVDALGDLTGSSGLLNTNSTEMRQALTEMVSGPVYQQFVDTMDAVDAGYRNLPVAPIDPELLKSKLDSVVQAANDFDDSGSKAAGVLRDMFEGFTPQRVGTATDAMPIVGEASSTAIMETSDQIIERIGETITFSDLYMIKAKLAGVIDSYRDQPAIQQRLIEFRNHITDTDSGQMAFVIDTAPSDVAKAFSDADTAFKTAKSEFANSEPVRRLTDKMQDMRRFDNPNSTYPGPVGRNEPDVVLGADQFVDEVISDGTGTLMNQLEYMTKNIESIDDLKGPFRDMFVSKAANSLRDAIATGATDGANPERALLDAFKPVRDQIQALGDTDLLKRMEEAYEQVRSAHMGLGDVKAANDALVKELETAAQAAQEGIIGQLIDVPMSKPGSNIGPSGSTVNSSAKQIIRNIMVSNNSENEIRRLMDKIAVLPAAQQVMARDALQAVALREVGDRIFGGSATTMRSGTQARTSIAQGAIKKLTADEAGNLFKSINTVFGKDSNMSDAVTDVVNMMYQTSLPSRVRASLSGSDTIINAARDSSIRDAVSSAILLTAGYMNPTAAMLRRITSVPVAEAEALQKEIAAHTLAVIVTDPKKFAELLKATAGGTDVTVMDRAKSLAKQAVEQAAAGGRYEIRVQEEDAFGEEDNGPLDMDMLQIFGVK